MKQSMAVMATIGLIVAGAGGLTGCTLPEGTGECSVKTHNPHESSGEKRKGRPGWMDAKASVTCTVGLEELYGTIKLQQRVHSHWKDVAGTERTAHYASTRAGKAYIAMTGPARCRRGMFRGAARGGGVLKGRSSRSVAWEYGNAVTDPCG